MKHGLNAPPSGSLGNSLGARRTPARCDPCHCRTQRRSWHGRQRAGLRPWAAARPEGAVARPMLPLRGGATVRGPSGAGSKQRKGIRVSGSSCKAAHSFS